MVLFFFSSRRRHTRSLCDWSSDVCSSDLAFDGDFLKVPLAVRALVSTLRRDHSVGASVRLTRINFLTRRLLVIVVEDLQLAHADIRGVALAGIANGQAVVAAGREREFKAR